LLWHRLSEHDDDNPHDSLTGQIISNHDQELFKNSMAQLSS